MKVYAICMAFDGADIIGYAIDHLIGQKIDGFVISDNGSADGTADILKEKQSECAANGIDFVLLHDSDRAFWLDEKLEKLARIAVKRAGDPTWILSIDQDEFWGAYKEPMGDYLRREGISPCYYYHMKDFVVTSEDNPNEPNPLLRMNWRFGPGTGRIIDDPKGREQLNSQRVIFLVDGSPWFDEYKFPSQARVEAKIRGKPHPYCHSGADLFYIRHYPVTSLEQMKRKYRGLKKATEMTTLSEDFNRHARHIGSLSEEEIEKWYWEKCFVRNPRKDLCLIYEPFGKQNV